MGLSYFTVKIYRLPNRDKDVPYDQYKAQIQDTFEDLLNYEEVDDTVIDFVSNKNGLVCKTYRFSCREKIVLALHEFMNVIGVLAPRTSFILYIDASGFMFDESISYMEKHKLDFHNLVGKNIVAKYFGDIEFLDAKIIDNRMSMKFLMSSHRGNFPISISALLSIIREPFLIESIINGKELILSIIEMSMKRYKGESCGFDTKTYNKYFEDGVGNAIWFLRDAQGKKDAISYLQSKENSSAYDYYSYLCLAIYLWLHKRYIEAPLLGKRNGYVSYIKYIDMQNLYLFFHRYIDTLFQYLSLEKRVPFIKSVLYTDGIVVNVCNVGTALAMVYKIKTNISVV